MAAVQVTDGTRVLGVSNGVPLLTSITAAGCSVTALIAAFLAAAPAGRQLEAAAAALAVFGCAPGAASGCAPQGVWRLAAPRYALVG